ncbi:MAG: DUF5343 domain-containing protein [Lysobacterales bacterium]
MDKLPYVAFAAFSNVLAEMRQWIVAPTIVDKTQIKSVSGSALNESLTAMRFLGLIDGVGRPTDRFSEAVMTLSDDARRIALGRAIRDAYKFAFDRNDFDVRTAGAEEFEEVFSNRGLKGSTLLRAISFFCSMCKEAGIAVSPSARSASRSGGRSTSTESRPLVASDSASRVPTAETERFEIPIPGNSPARIEFPRELSDADWEMLSGMIGLYIQRLKTRRKE